MKTIISMSASRPLKEDALNTKQARLLKRFQTALKAVLPLRTPVISVMESEDEGSTVLRAVFAKPGPVTSAAQISYAQLVKLHTVLKLGERPFLFIKSGKAQGSLEISWEVWPVKKASTSASSKTPAKTTKLADNPVLKKALIDALCYEMGNVLDSEGREGLNDNDAGTQLDYLLSNDSPSILKKFVKDEPELAEQARAFFAMKGHEQYGYLEPVYKHREF